MKDRSSLKSLGCVFLFLFSYGLILAQNQAPVSKADQAPVSLVEQANYFEYHLTKLKAEQALSEGNFNAALEEYLVLLAGYRFVFLVERQRAIQIALHLNQKKLGLAMIEKALQNGWSWKDFKKNDFILERLSDTDLERLKNQASDWANKYQESLDQELLQTTQNLYKKDQKMALKALFKLSEEAQDKYAENKFAPHSEAQIATFTKLLETKGYPGERLIGNNYWASTLLSHHNSISQAYAEQDRLYPELREALMAALGRGEVSPFELALIEDWYQNVLHQRSEAFVGIVHPPSEENLGKVNAHRADFFLRSVEVRNKLVELEESTGMQFYLPGHPWIEGKIELIP